MPTFSMPTWHTARDSTSRDVIQQTVHRSRILPIALALFATSCIFVTKSVRAAGGSLTVKVREEKTDKPLATRMEIYRGAPSGQTLTGKPMPIRKTVPAGIGVVLDRSLEMSLADGVYAFRMVRGPEYRILSGTFTLERTSLDERELALPRMVDMLSLGWTSGDCLVPASPADLPLRMAAEDLHVASVLGRAEVKPVPEKPSAEPLEFEPVWISSNVQLHDGIAIYASAESATDDATETDPNALPSEWLASLNNDAHAVNSNTPDAHAAIENPFAWPVPVWLASNKIDGIFVLGDWLRLDRPVLKPTDGREPPRVGFGDGRSLGRSAERIYWNVLEAGFKIPPLAGTGNQAMETPVGYNRLYVAEPLASYQSYSASKPDVYPVEATRVATQDAWWKAAWAGQSIATNGPLLRPKLAGELPGHTFTANQGEVLELAMELTLSVRDPVDYLEVVHNGEVHYSARLDEFALAGGKIPLLSVDKSGSIVVRVVTLFEDHFRAAMSAPWYIEFDGQRRVSLKAVEFFQAWQSDYEQRLLKLPPAEIVRHAPFVKASRQFWAERANVAQ